MVAGASIALTTRRRASIVSPLAQRTPLARPSRTTISLTSQPVRTDAAVRLDHPAQRLREALRAADRQGELHHVGEDRREHDARARLVLGGDDVHIGGEQRADAIVVEMLAHHAEQVVLRVREELARVRTGQAVAQLIDRQRRVVEQRRQQRPHLVRRSDATARKVSASRLEKRASDAQVASRSLWITTQVPSRNAAPCWTGGST